MGTISATQGFYTTGKQRDIRLAHVLRSTADSRSTWSENGRTMLSEMIIGMQPEASVENNRFVCAESPRGQGQNTEAR